MVKGAPVSLALKIVIIGDGAVGKSSLLFTYINKKYNPAYIPTVVDNYQTKVRVGPSNSLHLDIWDTAGQEDFENIRQLSYPGADVSRNSLENIESTWIPELRKVNQEAQFVLIGTKADLMETLRDKAVPDEEAQQLCKRLKGYGTLQCSALLFQHKSRSKIDQAFKLAITCGLKKITPGRGCCTLL